MQKRCPGTIVIYLFILKNVKESSFKTQQALYRKDVQDPTVVLGVCKEPNSTGPPKLRGLKYESTLVYSTF